MKLKDKNHNKQSNSYLINLFQLFSSATVHVSNKAKTKLLLCEKFKRVGWSEIFF